MKGNNAYLFYRCFLLSLFIKTALVSYAQSPDNCKDIIPLGFYNKTNTSNTGNFTQDVKNWLLSDNLREYISSRGGGFGLSIPIEGINIGFGSNSKSQDYQKLKDFLNTSNSNYVNSAFANIVSQQIVDKDVIEAWSKCMSGPNKSSIGIIGEIDSKGEDLVLLRLKWTPRLGVNETEIENIYVSGGEYPRDMVSLPLKLSSEWFSIPIVRKDRNNITVVINAKGGLGSYSEVDPPKVIESPMKPLTPREGCLKGDIQSCKILLFDFQKECNSIKSLDCLNKVQFLNNYIAASEHQIKTCNTYGENSSECNISIIRTQEIKKSYWDRIF